MSVRIIVGDALEQLRLLPAESVHCCVTSPPYYGLRDYGMAGQIGLEPTPDEYIAALVAVFREVRRVLRKDGTLWLNIGDSYSSGGRGVGMDGERGEKQRSNAGALLGPKRAPDGYKPKDLLGIPWMLAFALRADGWYLRQDLIWAKPNPMPESITDRCTKAHEYLFLLSKSERYWFDAAAIAEPAVTTIGTHRGGSLARIGADNFVAANAHRGPPSLSDGTRNKRSVWTVASEPFAEAHFACFPPALIEPAILAGCPKGGTVIDPFGGAGTTCLVADRLGRSAILIELNPLYAGMSERRIYRDGPLFADVAITQPEVAYAAE